VEMPGTITSGFSEAEKFAAALRAEGVLSVLVTGTGEFRARLTQVALHQLRLSAAEEHLSRIALVAVPADMILVSLARGGTSAPIWGGVRLDANEIITLAARQRLHMRTDGPCRWGSIWMPAGELAGYGRALTGADFTLPSAARWRLRPAMIRRLRHLHSAGIRVAEGSPNVLIGAEAAHGLEQQLIEALVECLANGSEIDTSRLTIEHQDVALRFEALLQTKLEHALRMADICKMLGISARDFRLACQEQLGVDPATYARRRLMHRGIAETRWHMKGSCKQ
jgi:AraC-like DNA-binding protein